MLDVPHVEIPANFGPKVVFVSAAAIWAIPL